jgi:acyl carrier protein
MNDIESKVREILATHSELSVDVANLGSSADLYAAGLSSFASVQVMLALEEAFDVEFPDSLLNRKTFRNIDAITAAIAQLLEGATIDQ